MVVQEEKASSHRRLRWYLRAMSWVKSVEKKSKQVKAMLENYLKRRCVRAAGGIGARRNLKRAFQGRRKHVDARRLGHLVGLTMGKDVLGQAECREGGRRRRGVFGCAAVRAVRRSRRRLGVFRCPSTPARSPIGGKIRDIANEMCGK
jgi:hypothetical protein